MPINKIDISENGAAALDDFSKAMVASFNTIDSDTKAAAAVVNSIADSLGIISQDVLDELAEIYDAVDHAREPVEALSNILKRSAEAIRTYINDRI